MRDHDTKESRVLPHNSKRCRCFSIIFVLVVAALIALIVPLAVILPRPKFPKGYNSTVLVPLYSYPSNGSWDPLFAVLASRPKLAFTVIINPDSGPGSSEYPGDDYVPEIQKLNAYPNVQTVGYVRTGYATRNITSVLLDVSTYSNWSTIANATGTAVHGIFFDEIPSEYSTANAEYIATINQAVKDASGIQSEKTIIHNPGTIPDALFTDPNTDITVVFEGSYDSYQDQATTLSTLPLERSAYSYIVHTLPTSMSSNSLKRLTYSLSEHSEFLFLTDLSEDFYESFGPNWRDFVGVMPT